MMRCNLAMVLFLMAASSGCSGGGANEPQEASAPAVSERAVPGPDAVVRQFLEAVKAADHLAADQLLTAAARAESEKSGLSVAPPGSPTATFTVGEVEYLKEQAGAHVASQWSDVVEDEPRTDTIVWILRKEAEGWRIAGMATKVFEDEPPLILNFEDHQEMQRKQALVEEELERRSSSSPLEEATAAGPATQVR
jgi:hypothetical protein